MVLLNRTLIFYWMKKVFLGLLVKFVFFFIMTSTRSRLFLVRRLAPEKSVLSGGGASACANYTQRRRAARRRKSA
jgi:hypothetical protein